MNSPVRPENRRFSVVPVVAPDAGYAWLILISCFYVFGLTYGVIKAFGVFYVAIHQHFETTAAETSWITSIAVATLHVVAPVSSALSARYSPRSVVISGGLICCIGVGCGSFARSLVELYLTVGFLNGLGYGLTWTPTVTMLAVYFEKRRPLANGLASSGECILTFILTPLFQLLIDTFSWRGGLLILAGLQLNLCVCGMLLRPLETTTDVSIRQVQEEDVNEDQQTCDEAKALKISEENCLWTSQEDTVNKPNVLTDCHPRTKMTDIRTTILRYADFTHITNARFLVYSMFGVFSALGLFTPGLFLVPYARSKGIAEYKAAALISISAAFDLLGRVVFGCVANLRVVKMVHQLTASVTLLGTILLLCPLASSFPELAAFSAAYGLAYGAVVAIHITVLAEVVGVQRLGSALGFFMLIRSSGGLFGPPIAGFFIDQMSDYGTGFLMAGVAFIVSALFLLLLHQMN